MPRFSVGFGRRKSTAAEDVFQNVDVASNEPSSFRVLERTDVSAGKSFDGGVRMGMGRATTSTVYQKPNLSQSSVEDNMFADLKPSNRGSGSSNTTKTASTDASSRHSNVSTAPSSADFAQQGHHEEWKGATKKSQGDMAGPAPPKSGSRGFLDRAGRTFSFGGQKKNLPPVPSVDNHPLPVPPNQEHDGLSGRPRGLTSSTSSTATPPKIHEDQDFSLDMGSDFGQMFDNKFKRNSAMTLRAMAQDDAHKIAQSGNHHSQNQNRASHLVPAPIQIDKTAKVEASPYSWSSQHSNDNLLNANSNQGSPLFDQVPPPVPRHDSPHSYAPTKRPSDIIEDEDANLLKDSMAASRFLGTSPNFAAPSSQQPRNYRQPESTSSWRNTAPEKKAGEDNMFEGSLAHSSRVASRYVSRAPSPPRNKVMTPAQFERYRQDKERQNSGGPVSKSPVEQQDDEEDNYEDDEDDIEKAKQAAKQRRKQEAHMTVYRQQMMKVTGEAANPLPSRPNISTSLSTPNLGSLAPPPGHTPGTSDEDEDEEVPLAILAAHGFPSKARAPSRMSHMASNPDIRASMMQMPQQGRPGSSMGDPSAARKGGHLPAFARKLPQDPFVGAGLVNGPPRESMNFSGGAPAPQSPGALPPGGLVGVIASEERSRAMRRGSPHVDAHHFAGGQQNGFPGGGFDPLAGIPPQMMYGMPQMPQQISVGEQAQVHMTQQMQQFMQMQMQFMQMMAGNQANGGRPMSHMPTPSEMGGSRQSFVGDGMSPMMMEPPQMGLDPRMRTMSMVQPSSDSWIQPGAGGYAPSIHAQGAGYAPSIAPSERSNIGLPGRYRPVSHAPQVPAHGQSQGSVYDFQSNPARTSTMSGAISGWDQTTMKALQGKTPSPPLPKTSTLRKVEDDDDDDEGWEAMKAKREKKRSMWRSKKSIGSELGAFIS
ncbi:hypothetical protein D7B24_006316 [Verticillium nonalfalfae]|uniref:Uncharacterized protein n=1 Tax=Verticillium nonalfalfae TaxID=1051616 RepID=A0A3M9Y9J6_9PEZI|nr:uncharacterized protein D7B24_006316 [Verticillium nonalfalfae]RNJ57159.1 hypothetical protein D7B24_006316 [Verticillium nonalfalfae]